MLVLSDRGNKPAIWLALTSVALYAGMAWIVTGPAETREWLVGYALAWSLYLGLFLLAGERDFVASPWVIVGWALASRLVLVGTPVWLSDDLYRYLLDGRVLSAGINPFRYAPSDPRILALAPDLARLVNHPDVPTIYPPLIQIVGWVAAKLHFWVLGWRLLMITFDLALLFSVVRLFGGRDRGWRAGAVYALCPLAVWESAANGHLEPLVALPLVWAVHWLTRHRVHRGATALAAASLAKYYALLLLPLWIRERGWWRVWLIAATLTVAGLLPFARDGVDVFEGLRTYLANWSFNSPLYQGLDRLTGHAQLLRLLPFAVVAVGGLVAGWRREDPIRAIPMLLFAFLVIGPTLHPWYALWILPWLGDRPHLGHWSFVAAMGGSYAVWWSVYQTGAWELPAGAPEFLWSVVAIGWVAELWREGGTTPAPV